MDACYHGDDDNGMMLSDGVTVKGPLGKRIYGHSRFCNTDFDDKWACLNLSGV